MIRNNRPATHQSGSYYVCLSGWMSESHLLLNEPQVCCRKGQLPRVNVLCQCEDVNKNKPLQFCQTLPGQMKMAFDQINFMEHCSFTTVELPEGSRTHCWNLCNFSCSFPVIQFMLSFSFYKGQHFWCSPSCGLHSSPMCVLCWMCRYSKAYRRHQTVCHRTICPGNNAALRHETPLVPE